MHLFWKLSSLWLGRAPQHPLSRPSSFRGVKESFRLDVMETINNVQRNGWSCSPKHDPAHFTVLKHFLVWMVRNFLKIFKVIGWAVLPQAQPSFFFGVEKFFRLDVMQPFKTIQVYGWAALPNIPCHGPAHFAALKNLSFCCYADCQQRSNEWLVVLPQTRPSSIHGVEEPFCLDVMQPKKNFQNRCCAALPNFLCHGLAHFAALKIIFVLMLNRFWTTFKSTAGRAPPNTLQLISRCWKHFSSGWYQAFQKHSIYAWAVHPQTRPSSFHGVEKPFRFDVMQPVKTIQVNGWVALPNLSCHGPAYFAALKKFFVVMSCRLLTTFKKMARRASPNTMQLISRC